MNGKVLTVVLWFVIRLNYGELSLSLLEDVYGDLSEENKKVLEEEITPKSLYFFLKDVLNNIDS